MNAESCQQGRSGFTLIEVLISVVILATGLVFILQGMQTAVKTLDAAVDKTRCALLLRQTLDSVKVSAEAGQDLRDMAGHGAFDEPYDLYRWQIGVVGMRLSAPEGTTGSEENNSGDLYKVDVRTWRVGSERDYRLSTLIFEPPPETISAGPGGAGENAER